MYRLFKRCLNQKKQVDHISVSASKPGPSHQVASNLDPPRPGTASHVVEEMEIEYDPALPPGLGSDHDASDHHSVLSEEPREVASVRPKKKSHSHRRHASEMRSASDHH